MSESNAITTNSSYNFLNLTNYLKTNLTTTRQFEPDDSTVLTSKNYDNKGSLADFITTFRTRLKTFQNRLEKNSFITSSFSSKVKTAISSDNKKALATASSTTDETKYTLGVTRLAVAHSAVSDKLVDRETTDLDAGTYGFNLVVGDTAYSLNVEVDKTVSDPDTNKDVLRKVQSAIDKVDPDIEAFLTEFKQKDYNLYSEDTFEKASYLTVRSTSTGEDITFSLEDTSGDLMEQLGLDVTRSYARKNIYSVNGASGNENTNTLSLNNDNLNIELLGTTGTNSISISVKGDKSALVLELTGIINEFNDLIEWFGDNRRYLSSKVVVDIYKVADGSVVSNRTLKSKEEESVTPGGLSATLRVTNEYSIQFKLNEIGLKINSNGSLEITDDFASAIKNDLKGVYKTLAGDDGFFTNIKASLDEMIEKSIAQYVLERNSFITYDSQGESRETIFDPTVSRLINTFA